VDSFVGELFDHAKAPLAIGAGIWMAIRTLNEALSEASKTRETLKQLRCALSAVVARVPSAIGWRHTAAILWLGLCANVGGSRLTDAFPSFLYLDMMGTAAVAVVAGPLWGMLCGLITNAFLAALFPSEYPLLAFAHTNITGGFIWGLAAEVTGLRRQLGRRHLARKVWGPILIVAALGIAATWLSQLSIQLASGNMIHFKQALLNITAATGGDLTTELGNLFGLALADLWRTVPDKILGLYVGLFMVRLLMPVTCFRASTVPIFKESVTPGAIFLVGWISLLAVLKYARASFNDLASPVYDLGQRGIFWVLPATAALALMGGAILFPKADLARQIAGADRSEAESVDDASTSPADVQLSFQTPWLDAPASFLSVVLGCLLFFLLMFWSRSQTPAEIGQISVNYLISCYCVYLAFLALSNFIHQNKNVGRLRGSGRA
jgi:hypothetical protein